MLHKNKACFQATHFGLAVNEIKAMIAKRNEPLPKGFFDTKLEKVVTWRQHDALKLIGKSSNHKAPVDGGYQDNFKVKNNCTIFLGYSSNMVSCGVRETIRFLVQHKMVSKHWYIETVQFLRLDSQCLN